MRKLIPKPLTLAAGMLLLAATNLFAQYDGFEPDFVQSLVAPYLTIQEALAADNLEAAHKGAEAFAQAMEKAPEGDAAKKLAEPADAIAQAKEIAPAREAFANLSGEFRTAVKEVGISDDTALFVAHCPMAFNNKGGTWLQKDETVANPYYGSQMLRCGAIKGKVSELDTDTGSD